MKTKFLVVGMLLMSFAAGLFVGGRWTAGEFADLFNENVELRAAAEIARSVSILEAMQSGKLDVLEAIETLRLDLGLSHLIVIREQNPDRPLTGVPQAAVCRAQIYLAKFPRPPAVSPFDTKRRERVDAFLATPK